MGVFHCRAPAVQSNPRATLISPLCLSLPLGTATEVGGPALAAAYHASLEDSAARCFGNAVINCMCGSTGEPARIHFTRRSSSSSVSVLNSAPACSACCERATPALSAACRQGLA